MLTTLKEILEANRALEGRICVEVSPIESYTCYNCADWQKCEFAFDLYNLDGDCLAAK